MKKLMCVIGLIVIVIVAIFVGRYMYKSIEENNKEPINSENEVYRNVIEPIENTIQNDISIQITVEEEKISPNATLVLKKYYIECEHDIKEYSEIPEEFVNLTREELEKEYDDWNIEEFTPLEVTLIKEEQGFCGQHYILKELDGLIAVYKINKNGEEELEQITGISTEYLTQNDKMQIENGIKVYGKEELNSMLEDYE